MANIDSLGIFILGLDVIGWIVMLSGVGKQAGSVAPGGKCRLQLSCFAQSPVTPSRCGIGTRSRHVKRTSPF